MPNENPIPKFSIDTLMSQAIWPHKIDHLELLETHISWVVLTGKFAYKIKKPVNFGFVNYESLAKRKHFCDLEIELNRRFAPDLYLGVVPIFQKEDRLQVGEIAERAGTSAMPVLEYAVKMRQFRQDDILVCHLRHSDLPTEMLDTFAQDIADFHRNAESALPTMACVQPECIAKEAMDNFVLLEDFFANDIRLEPIKKLKAWTIKQIDSLLPIFDSRLRQAKTKRGHGDLHLKNIIYLPDRLQAFDGIEFNEQLQFVDILSEIAFPVMDLMARGRRDLGWRLLNAYWESCGDYSGAQVMRFYLVYRALVRAKVTTLTPQNSSEHERLKHAKGDPSYHQQSGTWDKYLEIATFSAFGLSPKIVITHGFSGSGKSTVAMQQIEKEGGVRIRSDVERHRLATKFKIVKQYSPEMTEWVYAYLNEQARQLVLAGFPVYIDATFLKHEQRLPFEKLAQELNVGYEILNCKAEYPELCERIKQRTNDPSDATLEVLNSQIKSHDPLTSAELRHTQTVSATS